ncbi:hypothetical protein X727_32390 [Mesorhizobium sp. L103C119B0]|nr:hypothetical protein X727_32390 [Mesorhizobium sp. L103C119B0]
MLWAAVYVGRAQESARAGHDRHGATQADLEHDMIEPMPWIRVSKVSSRAGRSTNLTHRLEPEAS